MASEISSRRWLYYWYCILDCPRVSLIEKLRLRMSMVSLITFPTNNTWISLTAFFWSSRSLWYCWIFYVNSALTNYPDSPKCSANFWKAFASSIISLNIWLSFWIYEMVSPFLWESFKSCRNLLRRCRAPWICPKISKLFVAMSLIEMMTFSIILSQRLEL